MHGDAPQSGFLREGFGPPRWAREVLVMVNQGLRRLRLLHPWLLSGRPVGAMGGKCREFRVIVRNGMGVVWKMPWRIRDCARRCVAKKKDL